MSERLECEIDARLAEGRVKVWVDSPVPLAALTLAVFSLGASKLGSDGWAAAVLLLGAAAMAILLVVGLRRRRRYVAEWLMLKQRAESPELDSDENAMTG
ncbi:hypothetical protein [Cellulomonas sp. B6]|uniref:hypothetical protein n=1 Tax=Cellulomonas sp. B6 TaxID=1295626 RepID=UPI00073BBEB2|nr:hypothetical protein [Cellulomonas sp. B6]KSW30178.1 hypothetical protein ATM99_04395 [Cellulomonas sp. B6]